MRCNNLKKEKKKKKGKKRDGLNKSYRKRPLAEPHALSHEVSAFIYILISLC